MKEMLNKKAFGFYVIVLAGIAAIVSIIRFLMWAPANKGMDMVILAALIVGFLMNIILLWKDNNYLIVLTTTSYSIAVVKLLTNNVGSFVDAFQGINMFGDATQVSTIISISIVILISVLLFMIAGFLKRVKE